MSIGSFLIDTMWILDVRILMLSTMAEGCYIRLLSICWTEGSLPSDPVELMKLCKDDAGLDDVISAAALFDRKQDRLISTELDRQRRVPHRIQKTSLDQFRQLLETHSYRARKAGAVDTLTLDQWGEILNSTRWRCAWCDSGENIQVEHLIPISRGGGNTMDNVCPLCSFCNFNKGAKTPLEWIWQK